MQKQVALFLTLGLLSGCATVNYSYRGHQCETLGIAESQKEVILKCPIVVETFVRDKR